MLMPAILFYDLVLFAHILAVVLALGVVFAYHRRAGGGPSEAYEAQARKYRTFGGLSYLLIVAAIFLMTAKPGA